MSTPIKDGGPAFPSPGLNSATDERQYGRDGMSLRDWLAGQALAAIVLDHGDSCDGYRQAVARRAYAIADAMLRAREAKP